MPFNPTAQDVVLDMDLTNVAIGYQQAMTSFIATEVFPVVDVTQSQGKIIEISRADTFRSVQVERGEGQEPERVGHGISRQSYEAKEYAKSAVVDDRVRANAPASYNPVESKVRQLVQSHMIDREVLWASNYFATGKWTGVADALGAATPTANEFVFWDNATGDPVGDIESRKATIGEKTGNEPNMVVFGRHAWTAFKENADVIDRIKHFNQGGGAGFGATINQTGAASLLEVDKVLVAKGTRNTAVQAATATYSYIVSGHDVLVVYAAPSPGIDVPTGGYTVAWTGLLGAGAFSNIGVWRDRLQRAWSDWVAVRNAYGYVLVGADLGAFMQDVTS